MAYCMTWLAPFHFSRFLLQNCSTGSKVNGLGLFKRPWHIGNVFRVCTRLIQVTLGNGLPLWVFQTVRYFARSWMAHILRRTGNSIARRPLVTSVLFVFAVTVGFTVFVSFFNITVTRFLPPCLTWLLICRKPWAGQVGHWLQLPVMPGIVILPSLGVMSLPANAWLVILMFSRMVVAMTNTVLPQDLPDGRLFLLRQTRSMTLLAARSWIREFYQVCFKVQLEPRYLPSFEPCTWRSHIKAVWGCGQIVILWLGVSGSSSRGRLLNPTRLTLTCGLKLPSALPFGRGPRVSHMSLPINLNIQQWIFLQNGAIGTMHWWINKR